MPRNVLVIDDNKGFFDKVVKPAYPHPDDAKYFFPTRGLDQLESQQGLDQLKRQVIERLRDQQIDCVVVDIFLGYSHEEVGFQVLEAIKEAYPELSVVMISGLRDQQDIALRTARAVKQGAAGLVVKKFGKPPETFRQDVESCCGCQ